jgi:hypothetical protein
LFISEEDSETDLAEMENKLYFAPALSFRSENNYINNESNWGYFLEFNTGYYNLNRQYVKDSTVDLGSEISGLYLDLTPTLFYNLGSRDGRGLSFKAGLGLGLGFLSVKGDSVLTEVAGEPVQEYDDSGFGFTAGLFLETVLDGWFLQIKGYGPYIGIDDQDLFLANIKMTFGKMVKI